MLLLVFWLQVIGFTVLCLYCCNGTSNVRKIDWRLPLAGGIAGGVANGLIHPIDTLKTILQTDRGNLQASLLRLRREGFMKIYSGILPAVFGSIPSSALYFGTYEFLKNRLQSVHVNRSLTAIISAAGGNFVSSIIFVPKEVLKQQLQAYRSGSIPWPHANKISIRNVVSEMLSRGGLRGLYPSYAATLARNIPSAMIRFGVYEELKYRLQHYLTKENEAVGILLIGAAASAFSSGVTTPLDVIKTRLATGLLPRGSPVVSSMISISRREGMRALFSGVNERMLWAALYGGIGLSCYEFTKACLVKEKEEKMSSKTNARSTLTNNQLRCKYGMGIVESDLKI